MQYALEGAGLTHNKIPLVEAATARTYCRTKPPGLASEADDCRAPGPGRPDPVAGLRGTARWSHPHDAAAAPEQKGRMNRFMRDHDVQVEATVIDEFHDLASALFEESHDVWSGTASLV